MSLFCLNWKPRWKGRNASSWNLEISLHSPVCFEALQGRSLGVPSQGWAVSPVTGRQCGPKLSWIDSCFSFAFLLIPKRTVISFPLIKEDQCCDLQNHLTSEADLKRRADPGQVACCFWKAMVQEATKKKTKFHPNSINSPQEASGWQSAPASSLNKSSQMLQPIQWHTEQKNCPDEPRQGP